MTREQVAEAVARHADEVTLEVKGAGDTRTEHLDDLGYAVDVEATTDAVFAAKSSWTSYLTTLVSPHVVEAVVTTDPAAVEEAAASLVAKAEKVGRNASVQLAADKKSFEVTPAVVGHSVDPATFQAVAEEAARSLSAATTTVTFVQTDPSVTTAAATKVAAQANAIVARKVAVSDGAEKHTPSAKVRASSPARAWRIR